VIVNSDPESGVKIEDHGFKSKQIVIPGEPNIAYSLTYLKVSLRNKVKLHVFAKENL